MYHHHDVQDIQSQYFRKPLNLTKRQALSRFLYNKETKEYCGRTTESWGEFYYSFLIRKLLINKKGKTPKKLHTIEIHLVKKR